MIVSFLLAGRIIDVRLWPVASLGAAQANIGVRGNSGSRCWMRQTTLVTRKRHPPTARPRRILNEQRPITLVRLLCLWPRIQPRCSAQILLPDGSRR